MWKKIRSAFEIIEAMPKSWHDLLCIQWSFRENKKKAKVLWRSVCMAMAWCLWQERNVRTFEDKSSESHEVWSKTVSMAPLWASMSNLFGPLSISDIANNWAAAVS